MQDFLNSNDAAFYHITTWSSWQYIQKTGLNKCNGKGISVIRVDDTRIINSIIALQLNSPEIVEENDFVLLKLKQSRNDFKVIEIEPDIVDEWTWPLHNNIMKNIHKNHIDFVRRFSIDDWDAISIEDFNNEQEIITSIMYNNSFDLVYTMKNGINFQIDINKEKVIIE